MKAALIKEFGKSFVIEDVPRPRPGKGEVLVKVKGSCLCPGDLKIRAGRMPHLKLPHIPGHEVAGTVEETGAGADAFNPGDRVVVYMYQVCGRCEACRSGRENLCRGLIRMGFDKPGGHAEYVCVSEDQLVPLPEALPFSTAAAIPDAIGTSLHAVRDQGKVRLSDYVLIYGAGGGLGLHAVQLARLAGARVIAVSRSLSKLEKAKEFGAEWALRAGDEKFQEKVMSITRGRGVDAVIDYVVDQQSFNHSAACLKKGGTIVNVGSSAMQIEIPVGPAMFKEIDVKGSLGMDKKCLFDSIELIEAGRLTAVVTETFSLDEINLAADRLASGQVLGRSVILF